MSVAAVRRYARTRSGVQSGFRPRHRAASPAACGAAADVPANALPRQAVGTGTGATKSGFGVAEFGPHELYTARRPDASTAPTATNSAPSAGNGMLPRSSYRSSHP